MLFYRIGVREMLALIKRNVVMFVALVAAGITCFLVPPDAEYLGYFDFKTLTCLFCVLAVVCALKNINFFYLLARKIVKYCKTVRLCALALVFITYIGSMLIANDMALLTFLPLGYFVLDSTGQRKHMALTFILQNIGANLGGMLTPFGNPQNLYLYTRFEIPNAEFFRIMAPPFMIAVVLIGLCCLAFPNEKIEVRGAPINIGRRRLALYLLLFVLSIAIVFRSIPYLLGLIVITTVLLFADRKALKAVDYPLLLTFVFFFIFSGNLARIPEVRAFFAELLAKNTLLISVLSCQCISNVPSAILLSQFTEQYAPLLVGVNIGGVGTLISSLASLITFREYVAHNPGKAGKYLVQFHAINFAFLAVLTILMLLIL